MPETQGYCQEKAQAWFARRGVLPMPRTVDAALSVTHKLIWPAKIRVKAGKYKEIVQFGDWRKPEVVEEELKDNLPF